MRQADWKQQVHMQYMRTHHNRAQPPTARHNDTSNPKLACMLTNMQTTQEAAKAPLDHYPNLYRPHPASHDLPLLQPRLHVTSHFRPPMPPAAALGFAFTSSSLTAWIRMVFFIVCTSKSKQGRFSRGPDSPCSMQSAHLEYQTQTRVKQGTKPSR